MELGTLGQTEASIIPVITLLSLGIGLVESLLPLCSLTKVSGWGLPLGVQCALGLAVPSQKAGPIQPWVAKIQACLCDQRRPCLCVCLSLLAPSILSVCLSVSIIAGYENYGYGYGYGQDNTTNYGYGMATSNSWEMPNSDTNANPSAMGSASADSVLSRINQRLDMVPHLETDMIQGGVYGSGGER